MNPPPVSDLASAPPVAAGTPAPTQRRFAALWTRLMQSSVEQLSMRWRFRIVVLAFGLPFLAYIVWAAAQQATLEKEQVRERARASATLVSARFEDHIEQIDRQLATAAQSIGLHFADLDATESMLQSMRSMAPRSVDNIGVWSPAGDSLVALERRVGPQAVNVTDRAYFREAIASRNLAFEGPIVSRSTGADIIQFARPIFDARSQIVGVISMSLRSSQLIALIDPDGLVGENAVVTVINKEGRIVARSNEPDAWVGKQLGDLSGLAKAFARRGGTREETGLDGKVRLAGYAVVARWPWIVMVAEPIDDVVGPVRRRLLRNLGLGLAIFGLALLIAGRVAVWTTVPLVQLAADTDRLGNGDLSHRSTVVSGGEIATLAANFNRMAAALQSRELALAASQTQLRAIADNVPEQITYVDRDERYRFVNTYPGPFKNVAPEAMIGRTILEVRGPEAYAKVLPSFERAMAGETFSTETSLMIDGRLAHYFVTCVPDFDDDRTVKGVYTFAQDITQRKKAELLRIESEKRLVTITDNVPAMICYVDETRRFRFANRRFEKWFDLPLDRIIGQPFNELMPAELAAQYEYYFVRGMQGEPLEYELQVPVKGRETRWLRCAFIPDLDETGKARGVYGMLHNVTKAKEAEQRLTQLAQFDSLTGLPNRHHFNETFARVLSRNDRDGTPLALMFLDIDHFKQVNDRHGHGGGDLLLEQFAQRLACCVQPSNTIARLAGDEFVVLLERMHSDDEPQFIARKIIAAIEKPFRLDDLVIEVTASIGIAMRARAGEAASVLMKRADDALYEAKRAGRNTFRMAS